MLFRKKEVKGLASGEVPHKWETDLSISNHELEKFLER